MASFSNKRLSFWQLVEKKGAASARGEIVALLKQALEDGRAEIGRRLAEHPSAGYACVHGQAFLIDQLLRVISARLSDTVRAHDVVCLDHDADSTREARVSRLGGDVGFELSITVHAP